MKFMKSEGLMSEGLMSVASLGLKVFKVFKVIKDGLYRLSTYRLSTPHPMPHLSAPWRMLHAFYQVYCPPE
jgi:hypothetical protein